MLCGILSVVARPDLEYGDDITDNSCAKYSYGFSKSVLSSIVNPIENNCNVSTYKLLYDYSTHLHNGLS